MDALSRVAVTDMAGCSEVAFGKGGYLAGSSVNRVSRWQTSGSFGVQTVSFSIISSEEDGDHGPWKHCPPSEGEGEGRRAKDSSTGTHTLLRWGSLRFDQFTMTSLGASDAGYVHLPIDHGKKSLGGFRDPL
jgi:hypothetical protein